MFFIDLVLYHYVFLSNPNCFHWIWSLLNLPFILSFPYWCFLLVLINKLQFYLFVCWKDNFHKCVKNVHNKLHFVLGIRESNRCLLQTFLLSSFYCSCHKNEKMYLESRETSNKIISNKNLNSLGTSKIPLLKIIGDKNKKENSL